MRLGPIQARAAIVRFESLQPMRGEIMAVTPLGNRRLMTIAADPVLPMVIRKGQSAHQLPPGRRHGLAEEPAL